MTCDHSKHGYLTWSEASKRDQKSHRSSDVAECIGEALCGHGVSELEHRAQCRGSFRYLSLSGCNMASESDVYKLYARFDEDGC